ncbi:MAG: hypothetical protein ABI716_02800 [Candidatus Saccharibacteria bacterium]
MLIIAVVVIVSLVSLTRAIFFSSQTTTTPQGDTSQTALLSSSADRSVRMTVRGNIVANEDFRSYQITVTPSSRSLVSYTGYLGSGVSLAALDNNIPAYEQFVYALNRADLTKGAELSGDKNDTRGVCATGLLYSFAILKADTSIKTLWTSTCKGSPGSLDGSVTQLNDLMRAQIPGSRSLISKINL